MIAFGKAWVMIAFGKARAEMLRTVTVRAPRSLTLKSKRPWRMTKVFIICTVSVLAEYTVGSCDVGVVADILDSSLAEHVILKEVTKHVGA